MEGERQQAELVVVEQLLRILPPRTRHWVACWCPMWLSEAQELWENYQAADRAPVDGKGKPPG